MAVSHYQFEAIHPFDDGNGRTGRIMNILLLIQAGLLEIPVLYLSRYIIHHKSDYYRLLREVTEHSQWEPWILFILKGVEETATWTCDRIRAIANLQHQTIELCRVKMPKTYSRELLDIIFRQPYCKISFLVEAGLAKRQTASRILKELEDLGVLAGEKIGREMIYRNNSLLEILSQ